MSDATENAELVAGFRRLRPVVHEWLARDLKRPRVPGGAGDLTIARTRPGCPRPCVAGGSAGVSSR
jgi:hypothetical protein